MGQCYQASSSPVQNSGDYNYTFEYLNLTINQQQNIATFSVRSELHIIRIFLCELTKYVKAHDVSYN